MMAIDRIYYYGIGTRMEGMCGRCPRPCPGKCGRWRGETGFPAVKQLNRY
jgi:hypothetical protein